MRAVLAKNLRCFGLRFYFHRLFGFDDFFCSFFFEFILRFCGLWEQRTPFRENILNDITY